MDGMKAVVTQLHNKIEQLIMQAEALGAPAEQGAGAVAGSTSPWRNPGMFLPLVLIAAIVVPFNYLAANVNTLNITQINLLIQAVIFVALTVITYQVFRNLKLRRRDQQALQQLTKEETIANEARDTLIAGSVNGLTTDVNRLDSIAGQFYATPAGKYINDGQMRFHDLLMKFAVASSLKGGHSTAEIQTVQLSNLFNMAMRTLHDKVSSRNITLNVPDDTSLPVQNPKLVAFVLRSLLDNAIDYSPDQGSVDLTMSPAPQGYTITITDHGVGFSPEKLQQLFQPFSKADSAEQFTHQGLGFNLYLDKLIMTYIGGDISLDSQPGKGTTATIHLPNHQQPKE
jgi:signal transduction histidine kinase